MASVTARGESALNRLRTRSSVIGDALAGRSGIWRWLLAVACLFVLVQGTFLAAAVLAAAVPNPAVLDALDEGGDEGLWDTIDFPTDGVGQRTDAIPFAGYSDSYTECIALTVGLSAEADVDRGPLYRALASPHLGTCSVAFPAVQALAEGDDAAEDYTYSRMWNGSTVLSRPLLMLSGISGVRLATAAMLVVALISACVAVTRRTSAWVAAALLTPVLFSTNILTQTLDSFPHVLSFAVACFGLAMGVVAGQKSPPAILVVGILAGGLLNYVDYILVPPLAWMLFAFGAVAGAIGARPRAIRPALLALLAGGLGWIVGYGATWLTRWIIAVTAFGDRALQEILAIIGTRLQGQYEGVVRPGLGAASKANARFWLDTVPTSPLVVILVIAVIVVAIVALVVRRDGAGAVIGLVAAAPALILPVWYEVLSNHSQIHTWFTYRSVPVSLGIAAAAAILVVMVRERGDGELEKDHGVRASGTSPRGAAQ